MTSTNTNKITRLLDRRTFVAGMSGLGITALLGGGLSGCSDNHEAQNVNNSLGSDEPVGASEANLVVVSCTSEERELEAGLSCVRFEGDDRFEAFLNQGGAQTDAEVVSFLGRELAGSLSGVLSLLGGAFGCSTLQTHTQEGEAVFGRNFDWQNCDACIVDAHPAEGYASVSTVNVDFLSQYGTLFDQLPAEVRSLALMYAPLDGMNDQGLAVAVLMIQDSATIAQNRGLTSLTTTTAVRALLNRTATVDEALALLETCDMHASMGLMVHFALADAAGRSVVVEYIDGEMTVIDTPVVTNFYVSNGPKHGVGTAQSHERFDILSERLSASETRSMDEVRDALSRVSKQNYNDGETTEWSMVCNQTTGEVRYYHREDFSHGYAFKLSEGGENA